MSEVYLDSHEVSFADYPRSLPSRAADFPPPGILKSPRVLARVHAEAWGCYACGRWQVKLEAHHVCGGMKGRSDELTNLCPLCLDCHPWANTARLPKGRILFLMWKYSREYLDWVRLAVLNRQFLPDLLADPWAPALNLPAAMR